MLRILSYFSFIILYFIISFIIIISLLLSSFIKILVKDLVIPISSYNFYLWSSNNSFGNYIFWSNCSQITRSCLFMAGNYVILTVIYWYFDYDYCCCYCHFCSIFQIKTFKRFLPYFVLLIKSAMSGSILKIFYWKNPSHFIENK